MTFRSPAGSAREAQRKYAGSAREDTSPAPERGGRAADAAKARTAPEGDGRRAEGGGDTRPSAAPGGHGRTGGTDPATGQPADHVAGNAPAGLVGGPAHALRTAPGVRAGSPPGRRPRLPFPGVPDAYGEARAVRGKTARRRPPALGRGPGTGGDGPRHTALTSPPHTGHGRNSTFRVGGLWIRSHRTGPSSLNRRNRSSHTSVVTSRQPPLQQSQPQQSQSQSQSRQQPSRFLRDHGPSYCSAQQS